MTTIFPGFGDTKYIVQTMSDCLCVDETYVPITDADVGGVRVVTATWPAHNGNLEGTLHYVATGSIDLNAADVASPTTYYVYMEDVAGVPTAKVSTTNPIINPAVDEYYLMTVVRFKSVGGTVTYYFNKYPSQNGVYELAHNIKEDSIFLDPAWVGGLAPTMAAGGKVSTASGYVRFPGNEPRAVSTITNGALLLDNESAIVVGTDNVATYADGTAITAGKFVKMLVGVIRDKGGLNSGKYIIMRQNKPAVEYADRAAALADAEGKAATSFPGAYKAAVTPICYVITVMGVGATSDYTQAGAYPAGDIVDIRESGLTGRGGGGAGVTDHSLLSNLNVDDHTQYLLADGSRALSGNWNVGAKSITSTSTLSGTQLISTIAVGTKPLDVTSTTVCTNLNADTVDAIHGTDLLKKDGTVAMTGALDMGAKGITNAAGVATTTVTASGLAKALTFESTQATGTAPLAVASTTVVTNLNADTVDGVQGANIVTADGLTSLSAAWDAGPWQIRAETFQSDVATGTAPFTVASTTVVPNLNASSLQGNAASAFAVAAKGVTNGDTHDHSGGDGAQIAHSGLSGLTAPADDHTQYLLADGTRALSGDWAAGSKNITTTGSVSGSTLVSTLASGGAAPMTITSTTKVTNLNADYIDGLHSTALLLADGSQDLTGNLSVTGGVTIDGVDISAHAANINAHHTIATIADGAAAAVLGLTDQEIDLDTQTANYVLAGPTSGAAAKPAFRAVVAADIDIARTQGTLTLANGANANITLTDGVNQYIVSGPTAAFSMSGFTGGVGGRTITILNDTIAKNMTATHNATSTAANQIWCSGTLADTSTTNQGVMVFTYFATKQRWVLVSILT
jgi:hypothetical protein